MKNEEKRRVIAALGKATDRTIGGSSPAAATIAPGAGSPARASAQATAQSEEAPATRTRHRRQRTEQRRRPDAPVLQSQHGGQRERRAERPRQPRREQQGADASPTAALPACARAEKWRVTSARTARRSRSSRWRHHLRAAEQRRERREPIRVARVVAAVPLPVHSVKPWSSNSQVRNSAAGRSEIRGSITKYTTTVTAAASTGAIRHAIGRRHALEEVRDQVDRRGAGRPRPVPTALDHLDLRRVRQRVGRSAARAR
jgi:ATP-dependent Clp protease ATP-binding subunit ClpA